MTRRRFDKPTRLTLPLTPFLDEVKARKRQFGAGFFEETPMPKPSPLDLMFLEVADKHGLDFWDDEGEEP